MGPWISNVKALLANPTQIGSARRLPRCEILEVQVQADGPWRRGLAGLAMDAITPDDQISRAEEVERPSMEEAMDAVRTLLAWAGDDPRREGLIDTPKRVVKAYREFFAGYEMDPVAELSRTFEDVQGYDDIVMLKDIDVERRMSPICQHLKWLESRKSHGSWRFSASVCRHRKP